MESIADLIAITALAALAWAVCWFFGGGMYAV
jgi:hypothetical protein